MLRPLGFLRNITSHTIVFGHTTILSIAHLPKGWGGLSWRLMPMLFDSYHNDNANKQMNNLIMINNNDGGFDFSLHF